jgi:hypothetical protein
MLRSEDASVVCLALWSSLARRIMHLRLCEIMHVSCLASFIPRCWMLAQT